MYGLQPVARIRQRAMHDGGQRIGEITLLERFAQCDLLHTTRFGRSYFLVHQLASFLDFGARKCAMRIERRTLRRILESVRY